MKKLCILGENVDFEIDFADVVNFKSEKEISGKYDLFVLNNYYEPLGEEFIKNNIVIRLHHSLLPSFNTEEPIKEAYLSGVKVTGVTVHYVENTDYTGKIIAQYPVLIDNYTSYPQLEDELKKLGSEIYPLVIKSVLEDKVFDIVELLTKNSHSCCSHNCCKGCS